MYSTVTVYQFSVFINCGTDQTMGRWWTKSRLKRTRRITVQNVTKVPQLAEVYYSPLISATKILRLAICNFIFFKIVYFSWYVYPARHRADTDTGKNGLCGCESRCFVRHSKWQGHVSFLFSRGHGTNVKSLYLFTFYITPCTRSCFYI